MNTNSSITNKLDWPLVSAFLFLMLLGWIMIFSASYNTAHPNIFDVSMTYGKQFIWICISLIIAFLLVNINSKLLSIFSYGYYIFSIFMLILVFVFAKEVNGARSWIDLGFFRLQPSEFAKLTTGLALANFISEIDTNLSDKKNLFIALGIIVLPFILVIMQHDMGSALVFLSFFFLLNRFGMPTWVILLGFFVIIISLCSLMFSPLFLILGLIIVLIAILFYNRNSKQFTQMLVLSGLVLVFTAFYSYSIDFVFKKLDKHQQDRINVMLGKGGNDWNVRQSEIAIGSGQFFGKGFLKGTQNKGNFLPAKDTDFIFCTVGEEWGFIGSVILIGLYVFIMLRILFLAERQKSKYSKVYGYAIVCVLMIHFLINIGMTLGLVPVIGIPLPALSYGGSSLISFTLMIFIFIRMDSERWFY